MANANEFERQRQENIARNQQRLKELGIQQTKMHLEQRMERPKPNPRPRRPDGPTVTKEATRKSSRAGSKVNYTGFFVNDTYESLRKERVPKAKGMGKRGRSSARDNSGMRGGNGGWVEADGEAVDDAKDKALEAAESLAEVLEEQSSVTGVKAMTDSQVSGGFWCQVRPSLVQRMPNTQVKRSIHLQLRWDSHLAKAAAEGADKRKRDKAAKGAESTWAEPKAVIASAAEKEESRRWEVEWLPRWDKEKKKFVGAGFSGGWRGFSIDQKLFPGDAVVVELSKTEKDLLHMYIFRAYDFDPKFVHKTPEEKQAWVDEFRAKQRAMYAAPGLVEPDSEEARSGSGNAGCSGDQGGSSNEEEEEEEEPEEQLPAKRQRTSRRQDEPALVAVQGRKQPQQPNRPAKKSAQPQPAKKPAKQAKAGPARKQAQKDKAAAGGSAAGKAGKGSQRQAKEVDEKGGDGSKGRKGEASVSEASGQQGTGSGSGPLCPGEVEESVFYVLRIRGYRNTKRKGEEFLVRWWYWRRCGYEDTWEPLECLEAEPETYKWTVQPPAKYASAQVVEDDDYLDDEPGPGHGSMVDGSDAQ